MENLIESLKNINYFRYIFFKIKSDDYFLQRNCIDLLLKGNSLNDYIIERMQYDTNFYIIDKDFYNKWEEYGELNENDQKKINLKYLRMNNTKISDRTGRLLEGKEFDVDYVVLSKRIYFLFCNWYKPPLGPELKREKIYLDEYDKNKSIIKSSKFKKKKNNTINIFKGFDSKVHQKYELEIYPIFILFYNFIELIKPNTEEILIIKLRIHFILFQEKVNLMFY